MNEKEIKMSKSIYLGRCLTLRIATATMAATLEEAALDTTIGAVPRGALEEAERRQKG